MDGKYKHAEAFCLMNYQCEKCGHREIIWNSRDGVTPYSVICPKCSGFMNHKHWNLDRCEPNYKPKPGQRIFVARGDEPQITVYSESEG